MHQESKSPRSSLTRATRLLAAAALILAAASCGGDSTGPGVPADEVSVRNNSFSPSSRTVSSGTTVTFRWVAGSVTHNVTFDDGPASANQSSGTYQRTFGAAGNFPYHCTIHGAGMSGTIHVN